MVFYLRRATDFNRLRRELDHRHLAPPVAVTCLACTGECYAAPGYTVALYQNKPLPYPFQVVVQQRPLATRATPPASSMPTGAARVPYPVLARNENREGPAIAAGPSLFSLTRSALNQWSH